ncbi:TPA: GNAT family N-acetyltransferase [Legionella pneumophila]|nr:GNAT family N-acetyltransferase [Legionella pneumophila]HAU1652384.1 GNAT family N-acetyltransferase [Legionella pneumophila]HAU1655513.1 GNAT family N-acetyltransferase [Legionella pneumophila]
MPSLFRRKNIFAMKYLTTSRLLLRAWDEEDIMPFYRMCQDPQVMEYFPELWSMDMVKDFIMRMNEQLSQKDFTLWAAEVKDSKRFIGFIGLNSPTWNAHFTPCVEIGWRLATEFWGQGYATEGAKAALEYAFQNMRIPEIVSFTVPDNFRSRCVMERIGMTRDCTGDFLHPKLVSDHRLAKHVLYRIQNPLQKVDGF